MAVPVYSGEKQVGKATTTTLSPMLKKMIALASVDTAYSKPGTKLQMELTHRGDAVEDDGDSGEAAVLQSGAQDGSAGLILRVQSEPQRLKPLLFSCFLRLG